MHNINKDHSQGWPLLFLEITCITKKSPPFGWGLLFMVEWITQS